MPHFAIKRNTTHSFKGHAVKAIGFRAEKLCLRFVVLEGDNDPRHIADDGRLNIGEKRPVSEELALLRTALLNVLKAHKPDRCGMRLSDNPQSNGIIQSLFARARIEGVCMEVIGEL